MIGKLICWITGKHKRGKRISGDPITYQCPRCKRITTKKGKHAAA